MSMVALLLLAAQPTAAPRVPPAPPPSDYDSAMRSRGFSDAGIAVLKRVAPRGSFDSFAQRGQALDRELSAAIRAPAVDVEKVAAILRRRDALMNDMTTARTGATIEILRELPPSDRRAYLNILDPAPPSGPRPRPIAPPAPPAPPPPRQ